MKMDLLPAEQWEDLNQELRLEFNLSEDVTIRCYHGLAHAAYEVAMSTAQLFSHKRSLGIVKGLTPAYSSVLPSLYKEGFQVQTLLNQDLAAGLSWVEALKKDTNFVLFSSDHPVTGVLSSWQDLDRGLNDKKIYSFRISHQDWLKDSLKIQPYSVLIASVSPTLAVAFCGSKFRSAPLFAQNTYWSSTLVKQQLHEVRSQFYENKNSVLSFEKSLPLDWQSFLSTDLRLFDRAIIYNTSINSEAVLRELMQIQHYTLMSPGFEKRIEAVNLCRWGGVKMYEDWWEAKPATEVLRGMLLISAQELNSTEFKTHLIEASRLCKI